LGFISGGFEVIYNFLEKKITNSNGRIFKNFIVEDLKFLNNTKKILINKKLYDRVVLTTSPSINKKILKKLDYKSKSIKYLGAICGIIEFNKRPIPSYWVGIADVDDSNKSNYKDFLAAISYAELDNTWNNKGKKSWPIYLAAYCTKEEYEKLTPEEWKRKMIKAAFELNKLTSLDEINEENIINFKLSFAEYAQPILSPKENLYPNPESATNCYFANMHNIFPNDRGQNRSFYLGQKIAKNIYEDFNSLD